MGSFASLKSAIYDREERKQHYQAHIRGLNALARHRKFLNDYGKYYGKQEEAEEAKEASSAQNKLPLTTDQDALRHAYRFIRSQQDDMDSSWEQRLVKRYYHKLFKEYCLADMSKYKTGKIGLRWRTEKEVISGKGQFICGNKHCDEKEGLASFEVNFSYFEAGENKQALVKLVACERCADKLHYRRNKDKEQLDNRQKQEYERNREVAAIDEEMDEHRETTQLEKSKYREKKHSKKRRKRSSSNDSTDDEAERSKEKRKKGKRGSTSGIDDKEGEDESFDEFLEGMFP